MATGAKIGHGTEYWIKTAAGTDPGTYPTGYTQISEVIEFTPGEQTADRVEATHMGSPDRRREYIAGLIDSGEGSFTINWIPGSPTDIFLRGLMSSGAQHVHHVIFPGGVNVQFVASLTGYSKSTPLDDRMTAVITVAVSGEETWDDTP